MDDLLLEMEGEDNTETQTMDEGIDLVLEGDDETDLPDNETTEEESTDTETTEEQTAPEAEVAVDEAEADKEEITNEPEGSDEADLESLFAELEDISDAAEKIKDSKGEDKASGDVLSESIDSMQKIIKKITNKNTDLLVKIAEMEAFGGDNTDPKMLMLSRHIAKANGGDEKAKTRVITHLKDLLSEFTGENYDMSMVNKEADLMTSIEGYNSVVNPKIKGDKEKNEDTLFM